MAAGPYHGVLFMLDSQGNAVELINQARTAAYLQNPDLSIDGIDLCSVLEVGGCEQYAYGCNDEGEWVPLIFESPEADPAPWYNANYPESADALGFYVVDWTGLGDRQVARAQHPRFRQGVRLSPTGSDGRVMCIQLIALARTERAMEYLFNWLSTTLMSVCRPCATDTILYRRWCDVDEENPMEGLAEIRDVGLTEGVHWEEDFPLHVGRCVMRQMSFCLTAGDPCKYLPLHEVELDMSNHIEPDLDDCLTEAQTDGRLRPDRHRCRPSCTELGSGCREVVTFETNTMGAAGLVVEWYNDSPEHSLPFRAIIYADPFELGVSPNPCSLEIVAEIYVRPLPPYSMLRWDVVGRQVLYRDATTGIFRPGYAFIAPTDPPYLRFAAMPCGQAHLVIEPATFCGTYDAGVFTTPELVYGDPHFPTITSVAVGERIGCP